MSIEDSKNFHGRIMSIITCLLKYDQIKTWDDDIREDTRRMLNDLEYYTKREKLYYKNYRDVIQTED